MNTFVQVPTTERYWVECGPEFGSDNLGKVVVVTRAIHGIKSSEKEFRNYLRDCMEHIGYKSSLSDLNLWLRESKLANGTDYYEYILLYVENCLVVSENPKDTLHRLGQYFPLKPDSVGPPKLYLGGKLSKLELPNLVISWSISDSKYIQQALKNSKSILDNHGLKMRKGTNSPLPGNYHPKREATPECDTENTRLYTSLIGISKWLVELGRIDITCEVLMMSSYTAMPREGHLDYVIYLFCYLKAHHNSRLVLDPTYSNINMDHFKCYDWKQFYADLKELIPPNTLRPIG